MKTYILLIIAGLLIPAFLQAQSNPLDSFHKKYIGQEGFYYVDLKTNMVVGCDSVVRGEKNKEVNVKILSFKESEQSGLSSKSLYDSFVKDIDRDSYIGLIDVKSSDENVEVMVKKENKVVQEFVIIVREENELSLIAASGNFDLKDLARLKNFQNCKGLNLIEKICEE